VLFLDELPEFGRRTLDMLREPMESGGVAISRAARQVEFPARFQLIAAMNPCNCGYLGHYNGRCRCTPDQIGRYRGKLSGPLLDRIDIQIEVPAVPLEDLSGVNPGESSGRIRDRVEKARVQMLARQGKENALLTTHDVDKYCVPDEAGTTLLRKAISSLGLSARGYHRILRVARTIADLAGGERVTAAHIAEAIQSRRLDRTASVNTAFQR